MRTSAIKRNTKETKISIKLNIDGRGKYSISTPIGFFTHMLEAFSKHGLFDVRFNVKGDIHVDQHHLIEDCGIVLGKAFREALGDMKGVNRAGYFVYPMDDALAVVALDIAGRPYLQYDATFKRRQCGGFDTDVLEDFFYGFSVGAQATVAIRMPFGRSDHHKIEAIFKAFGKGLKMACSKDKRAIEDIPSTKGTI